MYRPAGVFNTALELLNPISYENVKGVRKAVYETVDVIFCSFKTFGGTEQSINGVLSVVDTANVETWYRPDIKASSRVKLGETMYEVLGEPENINMQNITMKFKVRAVKGGA